ncbi:phage baseplate assembly protein V [Streptomyces sp. NPDC005551]|uniref:phage baseplate assembly protein V n=1 Tax=Streptomyces sp. NPDC005551 TaxID=3364725 RepID=UPI00367C5F19
MDVQGGGVMASWPGVYRGVVRSTADPQKLGRVRLQVAQVTGAAVSGWSAPVQVGGPVPGVGDQVLVMYENGDPSYPVYVPPVAPEPVQAVQLVQDWTAPTLAAGFTGDGNSNGIPKYRVLNILGSVLVEWVGGINITYSSGTIANDGFFLSAPLGFAPSDLRTVTAGCSAASSTVNSLKIDFQVSGQARIVGTNTTTNNPPWVSLNKVDYYLEV